MLKRWVWVAVMIMAGGIVPAQADVKLGDLGSDTAFVVNDLAFGTVAYDALANTIRQHSPMASDAGILQGVIENHLLAQHFARIKHPVKSIAMARLLEQMFPHSHLNQQDKLWQEYGMLIGQLFPVAVTPAQEQACLHFETIDSVQLKRMLGSENSDSAKIVDTTVSTAKRLDAAAIRIASISCADSEPMTVNLANVLESSDEASALQLWRGELPALTRLSSSVARIRLHEGLLLKQKRLTALDLKTLWTMAQDKQTRTDFEAEAGVKFDLHHSPQIVKSLMHTVTDADIDAYYDAHQQDYQQIGHVKARHITVATQADADRIVAEIRKGLPFNDAVAQYSLAEDKQSNPSGNLGVIRRTDKDLPFVKKLALILPAGEVSNPFRMPDGKSYEILWVDERVAEHLPKTDESVRSEIRREVAGVKAREQFSNTVKQVWQDADITLNKARFNAAWVKQWPAL